MTEENHITLRTATEADGSFLLSVYASTRAEELARVPWTAEQKEMFVRMQFEAQARHYAAEHPQATQEIICRQGVPIGRLYLDRNGGVLHILDITVLPEHRHAGAGSCILQQVMDEAAGVGKPVTIYVESYNPSLQLFTRLGFQRAGETGMHWLMKWGAQEQNPLTTKDTKEHQGKR